LVWHGLGGSKHAWLFVLILAFDTPSSNFAVLVARIHPNVVAMMIVRHNASRTASTHGYSGPQKLDSQEALNLGWAEWGDQYGDQEESYERIYGHFYKSVVGGGVRRRGE